MSTNERATLAHSEFPGGRAATVWYEWTAPKDGHAEFYANHNSGLSTLAFAGAEIGELRLVSKLVPGNLAHFPVQGGESYRIAVAARDADASGSGFTLSWYYGTVPNVQYGDDFRNAGSIDANEDADHGFLKLDLSQVNDLTVEPMEPLATGIGTRWWDWVALGHSPDTIPGYSNSTIAIVRGATPPNDDRADARPIVGAAGSVTAASLRYATTQANEPRSTVGVNSVWWFRTAATTGWHRFRVEGHPLSAILSVYPDNVSAQAADTSERTFLANGRVEVHLLVRDIETGDLSLAYDFLADDFLADGSNQHIRLPIDTRLWWNPLHDRLIAVYNQSSSYSFALPDDGSSVPSHQPINVPGDPANSHNFGRGPVAEGSPDGRYFYWSDPQNRSYSNPADFSLRVYRIDSPTQFTLVQRVSPDGAPDDEHLAIPNMGIPVGLTAASDGSWLYLITRRGPIVFSRDASSGRLRLERDILRDGDPESPFYAMSGFSDVTLVAQDNLLFVSGEKSERGHVFDTVVTAQDAQTDAIHIFERVSAMKPD